MNFFLKIIKQYVRIEDTITLISNIIISLIHIPVCQFGKKIFFNMVLEVE